MDTLGNVKESQVIVIVVVCVAGQDSGVRKVNIKDINKHSITEIYSFRGKYACFLVVFFWGGGEEVRWGII